MDDRGSDPVPENDSHGELIFTDRRALPLHAATARLLEAMWPHVQGAVRYMDELRASETHRSQSRCSNPAFYGLMPASISHEGYSAKPMHSYWDDFWALRGYKDAVEIAQWLGQRRRGASASPRRATSSAPTCTPRSRTATTQHGIDFLPGAAELGDFDATSTTIALAPGGEQASLPQPACCTTPSSATGASSSQRRDGTREWKDYTPYELRTRRHLRAPGLARARARGAGFLLRRPPARGLEPVGRSGRRATPRKPFFLGDLPHAWVASDYVRSVLDMFAYEREADDALVIAAGIPEAWLDGEGVSVRGLRTHLRRARLPPLAPGRRPARDRG